MVVPAAAASEPYGQIRSALEATGQPIASKDLLIAAHAMSLHTTLVSRNLRVFSRIPGLKVDTWFTDDS